MGAYSPVPFVGPDVVDDMMERAVLPTLAELERRGAPFRGTLYCRAHAHARGYEGARVQRALRRPGDPGARAAVHERPLRPPGGVGGRRSHDSGRAGRHGVCRRRARRRRAIRPHPTARVSTSSPGSTGRPRTRVSWCSTRGTAFDDQGRLVTNGGRVLTVTAIGADVAQARDRAYAAAAEISWPGVHYRRDIGAQALP